MGYCHTKTTRKGLATPYRRLSAPAHQSGTGTPPSRTDTAHSEVAVVAHSAHCAHLLSDLRGQSRALGLDRIHGLLLLTLVLLDAFARCGQRRVLQVERRRGEANVWQDRLLPFVVCGVSLVSVSVLSLIGDC